MKKSALQYRFKSTDKNVWLDWHACLICRKNQWDSLHHIISPSFSGHVKSECNSSIFNSCPIHNLINPHGGSSCHVGNEAHLYRKDVIMVLLNEVFEVLLDEVLRVPADKDRCFLQTYKHLYYEHNQRVIDTL